MEHDDVVALLGDPAAVPSDADWLAVQEHWAVCDVCVAGPATLAAAVQGELSLIRFGLDAGRQFFRPWWFGIPIVGLVLMLGSLSYLFFSGPPGQPVQPTPTPTLAATATVTPAPTLTPTTTPSPTQTPAAPSPTPRPEGPTPSPNAPATFTAEPPTPVPTALPPMPTGPSLCPATCVPTQAPLLGTAAEDPAYAQELLQLTNGLRAQVGLGPLREDARLVAAAREYARFVVLSRWWATHPSIPEIHCGADCRDMYDRAVDAGYPPACVGENVMWGSIGVTPARTWSTMIASYHEDPANPLFQNVGLACYLSEDMNEFACVQVLAAEGGTPCPG